MATLLPIALMLACRLAGAAAAIPDSTLARHTARYDLYAPTAAQLDTSEREIAHAIDVFRDCFGEEPPRIAVVAFDSPDAIRHADMGRFRSGGVPVLPWVTSRYLASGERNLSVMPELGAVLSWTSEHGLGVTTLLPTPDADKAKLRAGDVIIKLNNAAAGSLKDFEDRFHALAPGSRVTLEVERGGATETLAFEKQASPNAPPTPRVAKLSPAEAHALSHEVGHVLLKAWVDGRLGHQDSALVDTAVAGHYGSEALPDWLDEAVATLCEFPALQVTRRALMLEKLDQRIPLTELFTMAHPIATTQQDLIARAMQQQLAEGQKTGMLVLRGGGAFRSERAAIFYAECLTLAQFLSEREGPRFVGRVAEGLATKRTMAEILAGTKHIPHDPTALETAWVGWLSGSGGRR